MNDIKLQQEIDRQMAELNTLRNYTGKDQIVSLREIADSLKDNRSCRVNSGIGTLDTLLHGFEPGELIVVSGPTKNGKSSLMQCFTDNLSKQNVNSLWFSFEMPMRQFLRGFEVIPPCAFAPQIISNSTLLWIKNKILEAILKYDTKVIFIDHLGFVSDNVQKQDRRIEIDTIIRAIKTMAIELDIVIFLIHHITKIEAGTKPSYENLKESSAVAQDSDKVLMIYREFTNRGRGEIEYTGNTILTVEVDRREGVFKQSIKLKYENNKFIEYDFTNRVN